MDCLTWPMNIFHYNFQWKFFLWIFSSSHSEEWLEKEEKTDEGKARNASIIFSFTIVIIYSINHLFPVWNYQDRHAIVIFIYSKHLLAIFSVYLWMEKKYKITYMSRSRIVATWTSILIYLEIVRYTSMWINQNIVL